MKLKTALLLILMITVGLQARTPFRFRPDDLKARRLELLAAAVHRTPFAQTADSTLNQQSPVAPTKSVSKAVIFSGFVPGSGQFYAKSYIKAGLFLAVEVAAWTMYFSYMKKGDQKDAEFKKYAEEHWSEYRYWSYVAYRAAQEMEDPPFQLNDLQEVHPGPGQVWYLIPEDQYDAEVIRVMRELEGEMPGFTHRLPTTKTQQYYEMIGKYPHQFGAAWDDASFDKEYNGVEGRITPHNDLYMTMRDESNQMYYRATYGTMIALVNHVLSAIDAGFTTRKYNRKKVEARMSYRDMLYHGEYVNMFGLDLRW